jgi:hypothetical protein
MASILITLLIYLIVLGAVWYIVRLLPLPPPFGRIAEIVIAVIALIVVLNLLLGFVEMPRYGARL